MLTPSKVIQKSTKRRKRQLLVILLDNAVKFTPAGGSIKVTCTQKADSAELIVKDTGIGIAESDLPLISHRFYRADKSRSGNDGSYGLGLSIGQWIVNKHGGKNNRPKYG